MHFLVSNLPIGKSVYFSDLPISVSYTHLSDKPSTDETSKKKEQNKEKNKNKEQVKNNYNTSESTPKQNRQINYKAKYLSKLSQLEDVYENPDNAYDWSTTGEDVYKRQFSSLLYIHMWII